MMIIRDYRSDHKSPAFYFHPAPGRQSFGEGRKIVLFAWLLLACIPHAGHAAQLGRLFFTPQERIALEAQSSRQDKEYTHPYRLTVNGIIQRSDGKRTIWVNGNPQTQRVSPGRSPTRAQVVLPGTATPVEIKVGQPIELNSRQKSP